MKLRTPNPGSGHGLHLRRERETNLPQDTAEISCPDILLPPQLAELYPFTKAGGSGIRPPWHRT